MKEHRKKKSKAPASSWKSAIYIAFSWSRWVLGVPILLFLGGFVVFWIFGGASASKSPEALTVGRIPLSESKLEQWSYAAKVLATQRDKGKIRIPARSLCELIEWGKKNPKILESVPWRAQPQVFLGVAVSIEQARANHQRLEGYDLLLDEAHRVAERRSDFTDPVCLPSPPEFEIWEQNDLEAYNKRALLVEDALEILLPRAHPSPQILALGEDDKFQEEEMEKKPCLHTQHAEWRVVSRSRYGPSVLRKNPSKEKHRLVDGPAKDSP